MVDCGLSIYVYGVEGIHGTVNALSMYQQQTNRTDLRVLLRDGVLHCCVHRSQHHRDVAVRHRNW